MFIAAACGEDITINNIIQRMWTINSEIKELGVDIQVGDDSAVIQRSTIC